MSRQMGTLSDDRRPGDGVDKIDGSGHRTRARADTESRPRRLGFDFGLGLNPPRLASRTAARRESLAGGQAAADAPEPRVSETRRKGSHNSTPRREHRPRRTRGTPFAGPSRPSKHDAMPWFGLVGPARYEAPGH